MDAIDCFLLAQTPPVVLFESCKVFPVQTLLSAIDEIVGSGFTFIVLSTFVAHPDSVTVYEIMADPAFLPVIKPEVAFTFAIVVSLLDHVPFNFVLEKVRVPPTHTESIPVIAGTIGSAVTETRVSLIVVQPLIVTAY